MNPTPGAVQLNLLVSHEHTRRTNALYGRRPRHRLHVVSTTVQLRPIGDGWGLIHPRRHAYGWPDSSTITPGRDGGPPG